MKRLALLIAIGLGSWGATAGAAQAQQCGCAAHGGHSAAHNHGYGGYAQYSPQHGSGISFGYSSGQGYHASGYARSSPHYHAPSVHVDRVYHQDYSHWTPRRGYHSHGHYDAVQHATPGHWHY